MTLDQAMDLALAKHAEGWTTRQRGIASIASNERYRLGAFDLQLFVSGIFELRMRLVMDVRFGPITDGR